MAVRFDATHTIRSLGISHAGGVCQSLEHVAEVEQRDETYPCGCVRRERAGSTHYALSA